MIGKTIGVSLALLCLSPTAFAQDLKIAKHVTIRVAATSHETFDASMARLATKAAFQPSSQPTQQELLGVILLMSLREQQANHT
jgi:hypothetical protein